jgi:type V secretory pathway adhesin AidA
METTILYIILALAILAVGMVVGNWYARFSSSFPTRMLQVATRALNKLAHYQLDQSLATQVAAQQKAYDAALATLKDVAAKM